MDFEKDTPGVKIEGDMININYLSLPKDILDRALSEVISAYEIRSSGDVITISDFRPELHLVRNPSVRFSSPIRQQVDVDITKKFDS